MFTKQEMMSELRKHMLDRAIDVELWFGPGMGGVLIGDRNRDPLSVDDPSTVCFEHTEIWHKFSALYDYAVNGVKHEEGTPFGDKFGDTIGNDLTRLPDLVFGTVCLAEARHILDGGNGDMLTTDAPKGYLSLRHLAWLADMEERSVRNAANPKLPDALVTEQYDKRTVISLVEARRWLADRKGFVPTRAATPPARESIIELPLPASIVLGLKAKAASIGVPVEAFIRTCLAND
jgi:hypothetical protein